MINGIEYYRRKRGMSIRALAEKSELSVPYVRSLLHGKGCETALRQYMRLSNALGTPIDTLLPNYDENELDVGRYCTYGSQTEDRGNCITVYRHRKGLSYRQLALRMGCATRESGRQACMHAVPKEKHLRALAAYEGISPEEFCRRYSGEDEIGGSL